MVHQNLNLGSKSLSPPAHKLFDYEPWARFKIRIFLLNQLQNKTFLLTKKCNSFFLKKEINQPELKKIYFVSDKTLITAHHDMISNIAKEWECASEYSIFVTNERKATGERYLDLFKGRTDLMVWYIDMERKAFFIFYLGGPPSVSI
jgi:hypothetical protein